MKTSCVREIIQKEQTEAFYIRSSLSRYSCEQVMFFHLKKKKYQSLATNNNRSIQSSAKTTNFIEFKLYSYSLTFPAILCDMMPLLATRASAKVVFPTESYRKIRQWVQQTGTIDLQFSFRGLRGGGLLLAQKISFVK